MSTLREEVYWRRTELGLTLRKLSKRTGLAIAEISQIETGKRIPTPERAALLMSSLGIGEETAYCLYSDCIEKQRSEWVYRRLTRFKNAWGDQ